MSYLCIVVLVYFLHLLLKLNWYMTIAIGVFFLLVYPLHRKKQSKKKEQESRFFEVMNYMDTMLYAFLREQKVEAALADVCMSLPKGSMRDAACDAHDHMVLTFDNSDATADGLSRIEERYPCKRLKSMHDFMLHVEAYGGAIEETILLLLSDKNSYEKRIRQAMEERKKSFREVVMSVCASLLICGMVLYIPIGNMDISKNWIVQFLAVLVILLDDLIILQAQRYLETDWLTIDVLENDVDYEKKIKDFYAYDEKKEKKLSVILAAIAGILVVVLLILHNSWAAAGMMGLFLIFLNQHRIGYRIAEKNIKGNIQSAFPNWLMDLVLLLQSENVQVALEKSRAHVPGVLKEDLEELVARLEINPEDAEPYHRFLEVFALPEVASTMSMLYSLSIGNSGNAKRQIAELIEKNQKMLDVAEAARMKDKNSGMYLLFLAPVVTASLKLVIDMAVFMLSFLSSSLI